jgi:hypothetical protein
MALIRVLMLFDQIKWVFKWNRVFKISVIMANINFSKV